MVIGGVELTVGTRYRVDRSSGDNEYGNDTRVVFAATLTDVRELRHDVGSTEWIGWSSTLIFLTTWDNGVELMFTEDFDAFWSEEP